MKPLHGICFGVTLFATSFFVVHAAEWSVAEKYRAGETVRVLVVPGHDNEFSGSAGNGMREADINLKLAAEIAKRLALDPQISVTLSRDAATGDYIPELVKYFDEHTDQISRFIKDHKKSYARKQRYLSEQNNDVDEPVQVPHGDAKPLVAYRLYATNHWANEQEFDMVLHVHFNDTWPRGGADGEYGGYSIYVPGAPLTNQIPSNTIGESIGMRLRDIVGVSNLGLESSLANDAGVIPDTKLIALGAFDTLNIPSILVEYSYVYEPHVAREFWDTVIPAFARATVLGFGDYVAGVRNSAPTFTYHWDLDLLPTIKIKKPDVIAMQMGLRSLGLYPPAGKTQSSCPMTGAYGPCTKSAIAAFQKKYHMDTDGLFGPKTRAAMNGFFGL